MVRKNIFDQLEIAADELQKHVSIFLDGKRGRIIDFSSDGFVRDCAEEITRRDDKVQYYTDRLNTHLVINKQPLDPDILAVFVIDLDGKVISSTEIDQIDRDFSGETFFSETMKRGFCISDIKYSPEFKQDTFFDVARLLLSRDGLHTIGVIVNRYSGNSFRKITRSEIIGEFGQVEQLEGLGETGEVYIVNRDKLMITESRFDKDVLLKQVVDTEGVRAAFDNEVGMVGIYNNYKGHPILGVSRYIEEMDWVALAEKDIAEAFAPLARLRSFAVIMGIVGIVVIVTVAIFFAKMITRPITSLALVAGDIAKGNLTGIEGIKSKDEIGNLADSFNKMTVNLKKFRDDLKQSEESYRDLIENSTEIIYQTDKERFFAGVNKTMLDKLGFQSEELLGMKINYIVPPSEREKMIKHTQKVVEKGSDSIETMFLTKKGKVLHVEINATAMYDSQDNFMQTRAFVRDITERKKVEAAEKHEKDLKLLSSQIISVQEEERRRISRELHDDAGQALTAMKINLELLENEIPESSTNIRERLTETKQLLTHTLQEVRTLSFELRPSLLDHFGIIAAIRGYSKNYSERTNIDVQVRGKNTVERFPPEVEILFYRCAQEALTNVAKHSRAKNVTINISQDNNKLRMKIKDDGKGFDVNKHFEKNINVSNLGLFGMRERVALMGGKLRIHSERNKGSELEILVPFGINSIKTNFSGVKENV
jgi:PAS domain S-box-containing protein